LPFTHHASRITFFDMPSSVFITGASSGIGYALALEYAARGFDLALTARRTDVLETLKQRIRTLHPERNVLVRQLDVNNHADVIVAMDEAASHFGKLDIVIANAGIGSLGRVGHGYFAEHRAIVETNVIGVMATSDAGIKLFRAQKHGQLVIISSVAAFRGLPGGAAYGASKAAVATYAEAIRAETHGTGIKVCTIFPGFIDTPINQSNPNRPFLITPERGAQLIVDQISRGVATAIVPRFPWSVVALLARWIPTRMLARSR
jgi:short-subunit dehydrogenase